MVPNVTSRLAAHYCDSCILPSILIKISMYRKMLLGFLHGVMNSMNSSSGSTTCFFSSSVPPPLLLGFFAAKIAVLLVISWACTLLKGLFEATDGAIGLPTFDCGANAWTAGGPMRAATARISEARALGRRNMLDSDKNGKSRRQLSLGNNSRWAGWLPGRWCGGDVDVPLSFACMLCFLRSRHRQSSARTGCEKYADHTSFSRRPPFLEVHHDDNHPLQTASSSRETAEEIPR